MLTALEQGVKGGVWFSLIDKVWSPANLWSAWSEVAANRGAAGIDHVTVAMFEGHAREALSGLSRQLRAGTYRPRAVRRAYTPKAGGGQRPPGIPTVLDRVARAAPRHVPEPILERDFAPHSYGFRPGKGCKDAPRRVDELLKAGYPHVVDADLKGYFDSIPHRQLLERVGEKVADGRVPRLVEAFLAPGVMQGLSQWTPASGAPQGAVVSPLPSNIYLDPLDQLMAQSGFEMARYADDFVAPCRSAEEAARALGQVRRRVAQAGLALHPGKTRVADMSPAPGANPPGANPPGANPPGEGEGFEFLGYRFEVTRGGDGGRRVTRQPRAKSQAKLKEAVRAKARRGSGQSLGIVIADVNRTVKGWFGYFRHASRAPPGRPDPLTRLDQWVRMRSVLRRRQRRNGPGRGRDHQRWPNAFFTAAGLFSMATARLLIRQPAPR